MIVYHLYCNAYYLILKKEIKTTVTELLHYPAYFRI